MDSGAALRRYKDVLDFQRKRCGGCPVHAKWGGLERRAAAHIHRPAMHVRTLHFSQNPVDQVNCDGPFSDC